MPLFDTTIWIVHRESGPRSAVARLVGGIGGRSEMVLGAPNDVVFESAARPHIVVLDVSNAATDPEPELDFARRAQARAPECAWILVAEPASLDAASQLFDTLSSRLLRYPPDARRLQAAVRSAFADLRPLPLSRRVVRDRVASRFARWFGGREPAGIALALDSRLKRDPLLASGEVGTGRGLLLRYAHQVAEPDSGRFLRVVCSEDTRPDQLLGQIEAGIGEASSARDGTLGIWLEELDQLPASAQARVLDWIEFGPPLTLGHEVLRSGVRWMASTGPGRSRLETRLALAFAELQLHTTPLRQQPDTIAEFVAATTRAWAASRREPAPDFDPPAIELLRGEPWPDNLAELESVVVTTLAHASPGARTIRIADLRFDPQETLRPAASAPAPAQAPVPGPDAAPAKDGQVARLAAAVAHEVRNPLVSIRTFSELLDEHHEDPDFRERFGKLVAGDIRRIEDVLERLEQMGDADAPPTGTPEAAPEANAKETPEVQEVDVTALLEGLLDDERPSIQAKRLLVLKELDRARPGAFGNGTTLRDALGGLLKHALAEVPERGDLYVASRHHPSPEGSATMRILFRYRISPAAIRDPSQPTLRDTVLEHVRAESLIHSQGGTLTIDTTGTSETLIIIDLPAPGWN